MTFKDEHVVIYNMRATTSTKQRVQKIKGIPYVYEDHPYWDPVKKQMRHKREYIGKLDADRQFIPNKAYAARKKLEMMAKQGVAIKEEQPATRTYYGATYLLDAIGESTGVVEDLKACFPNVYLKLLSLAYYLILESESPMYRSTTNS